MVKWETGLTFSYSQVPRCLRHLCPRCFTIREVDDLNFVVLPKSLQGSLMSTLGKKSQIC